VGIYLGLIVRYLGFDLQELKSGLVKDGIELEEGSQPVFMDPSI
jgi:hypothetical protein